MRSTGVLLVIAVGAFFVTSASATDWLWQVTTDPADDSSPAWSPDGTTLAFSSIRSGNFDIWTIPATGGTATQITTDPAYDVGPTWSPDGTTLAFDSDRSGNHDIWAIKPDYESIAPASLGEIKATFK
ncbi:MAG: PD40 domain-containing protein [Candidatus Coatesbacteria bacterium]|nr:MAG: PD40 domain-containing protein [Candidatus Coatesbacteria bacterium]